MIVDIAPGAEGVSEDTVHIKKDGGEWEICGWFGL